MFVLPRMICYITGRVIFFTKVHSVHFLLWCEKVLLKQRYMFKKSIYYLALAFFLLMTGCAFIVGKAVYDSGELIKRYPAGFDRSVSACIDTLEKLNISVIDTSSTGIKTRIDAEWSDGTPVTVIVVMKMRWITEISIRSGVIGVMDLKANRMIHDNIAQHLKR